jgi:hypothetical protein
MLRLNRSLRVQNLTIFWGLLRPLQGLTQKGEGANEGAKFTLTHQTLHHVFGIKEEYG